MRFLSTLSLRRATIQLLTADRNSLISIHALLAESDQASGAEPTPEAISIHALLAESDDDNAATNLLNITFLSTLSLRRATVHYDNYNLHCVIFYPRSPCGERRVHYDNYNLHCVFSIHALLAESDDKSNFSRKVKPVFYPRSPCGERQDTLTDDVSTGGFLSTLSLRRATCSGSQQPDGTTISIHALLAESDTIFWTIHWEQRTISIHALLAESDMSAFDVLAVSAISIHALLAESDWRQ